ncbi:MAG TPA: group III truncated hemoglobin [Gammaproteobacteria bacterium]|nr:group III truncated hemoglobin [Gammaproteobacteria bacterium]
MTQDPPRRLQPLCEKIGRERVDRTVRVFYERLLADSELGPYFAALPDLDAHIAHIAEFWWTAMGGMPEGAPVFDMIGRHAPLGITEALLERWLMIFEQTVHDELPEELAAQWTTMANAVAERLRIVVRSEE